MNKRFPLMLSIMKLLLLFFLSWVANACSAPQMRQYLYPNFKANQFAWIFQQYYCKWRQGRSLSQNLCTLLKFYVITPGFRNILKCELKSISFGFTLWIMHDDWFVYFCSISNVPIDRRLMSTIKLYAYLVNDDPFFIQELEQRFFFFVHQELLRTQFTKRAWF